MIKIPVLGLAYINKRHVWFPYRVVGWTQDDSLYNGYVSGRRTKSLHLEHS
mgnify:CR=1 FL=1